MTRNPAKHYLVGQIVINNGSMQDHRGFVLLSCPRLMGRVKAKPEAELDTMEDIRHLLLVGMVGQLFGKLLQM